MNLKEIVSEIDSEISKLKAARALLNGGKPGRQTKVERRGGKRKLSAEARKRISDAVKRRWAKQKAAKK